MKANERSVMVAGMDATHGTITISGTFGETGGFTGTLVLTHTDGTREREPVMGSVLAATYGVTLSVTDTSAPGLLVSGLIDIDDSGTVAGVASGTINVSGMSSGDAAFVISGTASDPVNVSYGVSNRADSAAQKAAEIASTEVGAVEQDQQCQRILRNIMRAITSLTEEKKPVIRVRYEDEEVWYSPGDIDKLLEIYNKFYPLCGEDSGLPSLNTPRGRPARGYFA